MGYNLLFLYFYFFIEVEDRNPLEEGLSTCDTVLS